MRREPEETPDQDVFVPNAGGIVTDGGGGGKMARIIGSGLV
jgi:hypothetical protein